MNCRSKPARLLLALVLLSAVARSQEKVASDVVRDPQALAVATQAVQVMGGMPPADLVATGSVKLVEGSRTVTGTIRVKARGFDQVSEELVTSDSERSLVTSRGRGQQTSGDKQTRLSAELSLSNEATNIPLISLTAALVNPDSAFEYVGLEDLGGTAAHHIRCWNTFASNPKLSALAEASVKDWWIDVQSGLPVKVSYERRPARGAAERIPVALFFSDYRSVNGLLIPYAIAKSFNGTPWATIVFQSVTVNSGLSDADFAVP